MRFSNKNQNLKDFLIILENNVHLKSKVKLFYCKIRIPKRIYSKYLIKIINSTYQMRAFLLIKTSKGQQKIQFLFW